MKRIYICGLILILAGCANKHVPGAELYPEEFPVIENRVSVNGANFRLPKILSMRNPDYPFVLRNNGIKAVVKVDYLVGVDGLVHNIHVIDAPHPLFVSAVIKAMQDWRFDPALKDGRPTSVRQRVPITFDLQ